MITGKKFIDTCNLAFNLKRSPDVDPLVWQLSARIDRSIWENEDLDGCYTLEIGEYPELSGPLAKLSDAALMGYARPRAAIDATVAALVQCLAECHARAAASAERLGALDGIDHHGDETERLVEVAESPIFAKVASLWFTV